MFKNKKIVLAISLTLTMVVALTGCGSKSSSVDASKKEQVIKIGTSGGYFPFTFMNEKDELTGFEIDVWNEIGKRIGYKPEFVTGKFSGLFGMLDLGKIDTISNQISITQQRKEKYLFSEPYVYSGAQVIVKGDNNDIKSFDDLKGKKLGVSLGSNYEQIARGLDKNNKIEIVTYDGAGLEHDVALGRVDAMLMDKASSLANIKEAKLDLKMVGDSIDPNGNAYPFVNNDKNKSIIKKVNEAITSMRKDGTLKKISDKWFSVDITKE